MLLLFVSVLKSVKKRCCFSNPSENIFFMYSVNFSTLMHVLPLPCNIFNYYTFPFGMMVGLININLVRNKFEALVVFVSTNLDVLIISKSKLMKRFQIAISHWRIFRTLPCRLYSKWWRDSLIYKRSHFYRIHDRDYIE